MSENPFLHADIDEVIHGRLRLGIMAYLSTIKKAPFAELKAKTGASDGNLSTHLRKLEEAGYIMIEKSFVGRRPLTQAAITPTGRAAWLAWLDRMQALIAAAE